MKAKTAYSRKMAYHFWNQQKKCDYWPYVKYLFKLFLKMGFSNYKV